MKHATSTLTQFVRTQGTNYAALLLIPLGILAIAGFLFTRQSSPHVAELRYTEVSPLAVGSVVPASCSSLPPAEHVPGELAGCAPTVSLQFVP
jgi:hypothetical protein